MTHHDTPMPTWLMHEAEGALRIANRGDSRWAVCRLCGWTEMLTNPQNPDGDALVLGWLQSSGTVPKCPPCAAMANQYPHLYIWLERVFSFQRHVTEGGA